MSELVANVSAYADEDFPGKNFAGAAKLRLKNATEDRQAFVFFARPFPLDALVTEGILQVRLGTDWSGSRDLTAKRVTERWGENRISWNNRPAVSDTNAATVAVTDGEEGDLVEIDVSTILQDAADGEGWFGLRLDVSTSSAVALHSSDAARGALKPRLTVAFAIAPEAPTNLSPSGAQAVSLAKPLLTWSFTDAAGVQASSQVQISTTEDFTSPEYDSTKQANVDAAWDLAATAYGGVADGATRFWRVRVWNDADQVSGWSDVAEFERQTKAVLTITNPAEAPDDFVEETTPPIAWTFIGRTQESAQVILQRINQKGLWVEVWRFPRTVTDETSVHVPAGIIKTGDTFRAHVYVWDDLDRRAIAGDLDYAHEMRGFTYQRAGDPAVVPALVAEATGRVKVTLEWTRSVQPDYFCLRRDGVEVLQRIDPTAVFVSGSTYSLDYWGGIPGTTHLYEVEAVVDDAGVLKHSEDNHMAAARTRGGGIWLVDDEADDQLAVLLYTEGSGGGGGAPDLALGESGETFNLVGSPRPVRIVDSERGYEGSVSGVLNSTAERDDFRNLKSRQRPMRLIVSTLNIPVWLGEASLSPRSAPGGRYSVSVDVFQIDEFELIASTLPSGGDLYPADDLYPGPDLYPSG